MFQKTMIQEEKVRLKRQMGKSHSMSNTKLPKTKMSKSTCWQIKNSRNIEIRLNKKSASIHHVCAIYYAIVSRKISNNN